VFVRLHPCWLAGLLLAGVTTVAAAQETARAAPPSLAGSAPQVETPQAQTPQVQTPQIQQVQMPQVQMKPPRITAVTVDWTAARAAIAAVPALAADHDPLARLNTATASVFSNIGASAVPVLLPFDTASFLADKAAGTAGDTSKYMPGYSATNIFFDAGPAGYDASFTLQASPNAQINFRGRVDVLISGSALVYDAGGPPLPEAKPVPELESLFPGIQRQEMEEHLRYTFVRFGVPYLVTIMCQRRCRDTEKVGVAFLKSLAVVGGAPQPAVADPPAIADEEAEAAPDPVAEPKDVSPDFTYYAPGDILPGTGMRGQSGDTDATVYAAIRFPMAEAPAYVNSQTFMNWGNCDFTGRVGLGGSGSSAQYRCRVNSIPLVYDEARNYAYPWRDNFCEHRYFAMSQCPAGLGHQGEDIRPATCKMRNAADGRCEPYFADVVAVRDGMVMRSRGDEALYLVVNAPGEHIRFRYLHMNPGLLDAAGMLNGRMLKRGDLIGTVDDYEGHQGGTSYHLHFDVQVPTRAGWVFVNPYMTLVAAYENLIGARGKPVNDAVLAAAAAQNPAPPGAPDAIALAAINPPAAVTTPSADVTPAAEHCVTRHHRRRCSSVEAGEGGRHRHVRTAHAEGHRESRRPRGEEHVRHAHRVTRHGRA
jgi:hypothetical protein